VAALVDLKLERLTPGFEHSLTRKSLLLTHGAFAEGLFLGPLPGEESLKQAPADRSANTPFASLASLGHPIDKPMATAIKAGTGNVAMEKNNGHD
jgi:hypothetical protein